MMRAARVARRSVPLAAVAGWLFIATIAAAPAGAQVGGGTFVNDSTAARDTLLTLDDRVRSGNLAEAARSLQTLLETEPTRLVATDDAPDLFRSVRSAVHDALLARPELRSVYADITEPDARAELQRGGHRLVERAMLLTPSGFEAALRTSQQLLERGRFHAAWRTLMQLEDHPTRERPEAARAAAELAAIHAAYLMPMLGPGEEDDRESPDALAARWAREAGLPAGEPDPIDGPPGAGLAPKSPIEPTDAARLGSILPGPLHADLTPVGVAVRNAAMGSSPAAQRRNRNVAESTPASLPLLDGDTIYVNDGTSVTAWDRFTLRQRWRHPASAAPPSAMTLRRMAGRGRDPDISPTVTIAGGTVLAATGTLPGAGGRAEQSMAAIEAASGATIWSADPSALDPLLEDARARGPVAVSGDTAVVVMRKNQPAQRLVSMTMLGVSMRDGSPRWVTPIGSAGVLPYRRDNAYNQAPLARRGVIYVADPLGVVAAVEAESGRPVWVRRLGADIQRGGRAEFAWAMGRPLAVGDGLIVLDPAKETVLRLDRRTGAITDRRDASALGGPDYLLRAGDSIVAMSRSRATILPADDLGARPEPTQRFGGVAVGRARAFGGRVAVPVGLGVVVFDPAEPRRTELIRLDHAGTLAIADGQIVTYDNGEIRSFLSWEIASALLRERIETSPSDPDPAATLAELAFRSDRDDRILPALDAAGEALRRLDPEARRAETARVFDKVRVMVEDSLTVWTSRGGEDAGDTPEAASRASLDDPALLDRLIGRLGALASEPEQLVAYSMAEGRLRTLQQRPAEAAASYQRLLTNAELAGATWSGPGTTARAELEAARRVRELVEEHGLGLYEPFRREAAERLAALGAGPDADADDYADIARGYPLAPAGVEARSVAAARLAGAGRRLEALRELDRGLAAAGLLQSLGGDPADRTIGAMAGLRVTLLADLDRPADAARALEEARRRFGDIPLSALGEPLDAPALRARFESRLAALRRLPEIGAPIREEQPQLLPGYVLRPVAFSPETEGGPGRVGTDAVLVVAPGGGSLSCYAPTGDGPPGEGPLEARWSRAIETEPLLLRIEGGSALLAYPHRSRTAFERIDLASGETAWRSTAWDELIRDRGLGRARARRTAMAGNVDDTALTLTLDGRTLAVVERTGIGAAIDVATGRVRWVAELPIGGVTDADVRGGLLALAGTDTAGQPVWMGVDVRTGEPIVSDRTGASAVEWVRVTGTGQIVHATGSRIVSHDPYQRRENWSHAGAFVGPSTRAWPLPGAMLLGTLEGGPRFLLADAATGVLTGPLDTRDRLGPRDGLRVMPSGDGLILAGDDAILAYDREGRIVGEDVLDTVGSLVPPVLTAERVVTVEIAPRGFGLRGAGHRLHLFDRDTMDLQRTLPLRLLGEPTAVSAIDGYLLISAAESVVVVRSPADAP